MRYWVDDDFTDNDTVGWEVGELDGDPNTTDGTWSASSGKLSCSSVAGGLGPPVGTGSIFLISDTHYKNVALKCTATLDSGCDEVGLVFGYIDDQNFWVKIYRESANYAYTYQVTSGSWISRGSNGVTITDGTPIDMEASAYGVGSYTAGPGRQSSACGSRTGPTTSSTTSRSSMSLGRTRSAPPTSASRAA